MEGQGAFDLTQNRTFLFELAKGEREHHVALQVSNLIFALLLFECHAYIVSSGGDHGQMLSLQDGLVYLETREQNELRARALIANFERNRMALPSWVNEMVARYQELGH